MFFDTGDVRADRLTGADAARFHVLCNQPSVLRWMPDWQSTPEEAGELLAYFIGGYDAADPARRPYVLALRDRQGGGLIGVCGFGPKDELGGEVEICYFLDVGWTGRGLMGQVVPRAIALYFATFGRPCLLALVNEDNVASLRVLQRNGFCPVPAGDGLPAHWRRERDGR